MTMPTLPTNDVELGNRLSEYPGKKRYIWVAVIVVALVIALFGGVGPLEFDSYLRLLFGVVAIAGAGRFFYEITARADVFEYGFRVSTLFRTIDVRWKDIANISHQVRKSYLYGLIPMPGTQSNIFTITLANRETVVIHSLTITNAEQLIETIARMWAQSKQPIQATQATQATQSTSSGEVSAS